MRSPQIRLDAFEKESPLHCCWHTEEEWKAEAFYTFVCLAFPASLTVVGC